MAGDPMWELTWFDYYLGEFGYFERTAQSFDLARFYAAYGIEHDPHAVLERLYLLGIMLDKLSFVRLDEPRGVHHLRMLRELVEELEQ